MDQQTFTITSSQNQSPSHTRCQSLLNPDPKQVALIFLKSTLTRKLQELLSISFRKITNHNHLTSASRFKQRHRDCMKSSQQFDKKPPTREKSQTQRHSTSSFHMLDDLMMLTQDVKTVLNEVSQCQKLTQIVSSAKRIEEVVTIQNKRLGKLKNINNRSKQKSKIYDVELTVNCIAKLLRFIGQLSNLSENTLILNSQIEQLQQKLDQAMKSTKEKQTKNKGDDNSVTKETAKAIQTLVTIMKDHKINNIKRKIQQQSKKFSDIRKQLFEGVLSSIAKAQTLQLSNLSQITQLSSKLLEEQPSIEKNIAHIQKQKRVFQKILNETKGEQNKAAYYNLIDTSIYLVKLFNNLKEKGSNTTNQDMSRLKSPSKMKKPVSSKTSRKQKSSNITKSQIDYQAEPVVESFRMQQSYSKQEASLKNQLIDCTILFAELKDNIGTGIPPLRTKDQMLQKHTSDDLKKMIATFYDVIEEGKKQTQDLKDFIETLSFDIQSLKTKQQSLTQIVESQKERQQYFKDLLQRICQIATIQSEEKIHQNYEQLVQKVKYKILQKNLSKNQQVKQKTSDDLQNLSKLCEDYLSTMQQPLLTVSCIPLQLSSLCPPLSLIIQKFSQILEQNIQLINQRNSEQNKLSLELVFLMESSKLEIQGKDQEISLLKNTVENLNDQICRLRSEVTSYSKGSSEADMLRQQITLLNNQRRENTQKYCESISALSRNIQALDQKNRYLSNSELELRKNIQSLKQQHLDQKHYLEMEIHKYINKEKQLILQNTKLQSSIFESQRQIKALNNQFEKTKSEISQEDVVNSLREQNAILRNQVIQKGKMICQMQTIEKSPRSLKAGAGSLQNIVLQLGDTSFKKKNTNSSVDMLKQYRTVDKQITVLLEDKIVLDRQVQQMKEKIGILNLQRSRDEGIIFQLRKDMKIIQSELNNCNFQNQRLKREVEEMRRIELKLKQRIRGFQISDHQGILKDSSRLNNQFYTSNSHHQASRTFSNLDDRSTLLKKIDYLQGQLYNQGSKLLKCNANREQDLKILMSQNQLLQQQVMHINNKLCDEKTKFTISPKVVEKLEDSMKKMQLQLLKLKHEETILCDELRNISNPEITSNEEINYKPAKSSYQFVTGKFGSRVKKSSQATLSPRGTKAESQFKKLQKQKESLASKVKLLSVFTIIDQQNKAFVHNINKIISGILEFLSTSQEFQQCDYTDVDYMSTLSEYLYHQDYEGYFQTLQTFFKDLFLNVFQRKNLAMIQQTDQLLYLKDRMQELLSQKIDEIEEEQQKLTYSQRTPLKNYNEEKGLNESMSQVRRLVRMFLKYKDPKILRQLCELLNINDEKMGY